ncbi:LacI family transcriptional regulator [Leifsonia shinshuensis]|uniref:LacI family DNA-binding transcriptional regulator n=1 Tax=Leifsonia shinshuensis TaxID=150026 RepID=UPI001F50A9D7|nr:LacI family DNA-binding transcriptional regulator [Leifsonia shinshuensis]MCI0158748.1 LacI family transcriptional regulator [Leifsonia shinshuensis]
MTKPGAGARRVTLRDVGALAGVDPSIASRVLGGEMNRVTEGTRERIFEAAKELGWRPHAAARSLRKGTTSMLAVIVPSLYNPAYSGMMKGVQLAAAAEDHVVVFSEGTAGEGTRELERLSEYVDGIIWASSQADGHDEALPASVAPTILLNRQGFPGLPAVVGPDAEGARMAARHLISLGHTRLGVLTGPTSIDTATRRLDAFLSEARLYGAQVVWQASVELDIDAAQQAAAAMVALPRSERPTAVFAAALSASFGLINAARQAGLEVPADLSVVGLDDAEVAEIISPPLTTVRMPHVAMGMEAVRNVLRLIRGEDLPPTIEVTSPSPELIVRGSTSNNLDRTVER